MGNGKWSAVRAEWEAQEKPEARSLPSVTWPYDALDLCLAQFAAAQAVELFAALGLAHGQARAVATTYVPLELSCLPVRAPVKNKE